MSDSFTYRMIDLPGDHPMMMTNGDGEMATGVTVKKDELLEELRKNRATHRDEFLKAQEGYRDLAIKELDAMLAEARENKPIRRAVSLVEPKDHSKDYDRIIRMLEMCTRDEIFVDEREFAQYVQDDWGWKMEFMGTNSLYNGR